MFIRSVFAILTMSLWLGSLTYIGDLASAPVPFSLGLAAVCLLTTTTLATMALKRLWL